MSDPDMLYQAKSTGKPPLNPNDATPRPTLTPTLSLVPDQPQLVVLRVGSPVMQVEEWKWADELQEYVAVCFWRVEKPAEGNSIVGRTVLRAGLLWELTPCTPPVPPPQDVSSGQE